MVNEWKADDQCSSSLSSSFFSAGGKHGLLIGGNLQLLIYTGAIFFI